MSLRLLVVAPYPVLPPIAGGKVRIVQLARALAGLSVDVTVAAPWHPRQRAALAAAEPFSLRAVPYPFALPFLLTDRALPYGYLVSFQPGYGALLAPELARCDVCQVSHPAFAGVLDRLPRGTPVVYDAQNVEFDYVRSEARSSGVARRCGARVRALERRLVDRSDRVFTCSGEDARRLAELYGAPPGRFLVVPNGIDLAATPEASARDRGSLPPALARLPRLAVFSGSAVAHNHAAVDAILGRLAPALAGEVGFAILGPCARRFRGRGGANVVLDPDCDDAGAWAVPGAVAINPVEQGSGTSLKVLHYLARGLPVLSTPFGARGLDALARFVALAPLAGFAEALRRDPAPPAGARAALEAYDWRRIAGRAREAYGALSGSSE